jgi:hypothetical protein
MVIYDDTSPWPPPLDCLSEDQRASFWIGCIVREGVALEDRLRWLWERLRDDPPPRFWGGMFPGVVATVASPPSEILAETVSLATRVLDQADAAHKERNRVAHDNWVQQEPDEPTRFDREREGETLIADSNPNTRHTEDFRVVYEVVARAAFSLEAIVSLVNDDRHAALPPLFSPVLQPGSRAAFVQLARGEFDLLRPRVARLRS